MHPCEVPQPPEPPSQAGDNDGGGGAEAMPRVNVSDKCVPSSFGVGMMFVTVAARGAADASFSVVASLLGKVGVLCSARFCCGSVHKFASSAPCRFPGGVRRSSIAAVVCSASGFFPGRRLSLVGVGVVYLGPSGLAERESTLLLPFFCFCRCWRTEWRGGPAHGGSGLFMAPI